MNANDDYLRIPADFFKYLGGIRWSRTDDGIDFCDGKLFVFKSELALFLEGFDSVRSLVSFGYLLYMMRMLGHGEADSSPESHPNGELLDRIRMQCQNEIGSLPESGILRQAYQKAGRLPRNAGVLCALLCLDIPAAPGEIFCQEVIVRLLAPLQPNVPYPSWYAGFAEPYEPPVAPLWFIGQIRHVLRNYSEAELEHILRHGSWPPKDEGRQVSELIHPPHTFANVVAALAETPRLASAIPFVSQLVSALSIPPRRLAHTELPIGGYADISSRGRPEQLLPSQFALETDEFTRRFAENELLYFRREEPPTGQREELVLLLDQGVRTWGIVRSLLSAAALALVKLAERRKQTFWLAGTSNGGKAIDALNHRARFSCTVQRVVF